MTFFPCSYKIDVVRSFLPLQPLGVRSFLPYSHWVEGVRSFLPYSHRTEGVRSFLPYSYKMEGRV
jgi:hypothetical protein